MPIRKLISADEATSRMISGAQNASSRWEDGVRNPRRSFKEAALAAAAKHKARTLEALNEDRFAKGMSQVNEEQAIQTALAVGGGAVAAGMQARETKIRSRMGKYFGLLAPHMDKVNALPTTTSADAEKKMLENLRGMRDIGKKMRE